MTDDNIETTDILDKSYVLRTVRELFENERVDEPDSMYLGDVLLAELAIRGLAVVRKDWSK